MEEIHKLRTQISHIVQTNFQDSDVDFPPNIRPPNELQVCIVSMMGIIWPKQLYQLKVIRQLIAAGFIDQVAVRKDCVEKTLFAGVQHATSRGVPYKALGISEDVFIHPSSVLMNLPPPEYIVFNEVIRSTRVWLKGWTNQSLRRFWISLPKRSNSC